MLLLSSETIHLLSALMHSICCLVAFALDRHGRGVIHQLSILTLSVCPQGPMHSVVTVFTVDWSHI
eukprot:scaffold264745_cov36-Prasinocladus_malaysianus.AAC.2